MNEQAYINSSRADHEKELRELIGLPASLLNDHPLITKFLKAKLDEVRKDGLRGAWIYDSILHQRLLNSLATEEFIMNTPEVRAIEA